MKAATYWGDPYPGVGSVLASGTLPFPFAPFLEGPVFRSSVFLGLFGGIGLMIRAGGLVTLGQFEHHAR